MTDIAALRAAMLRAEQTHQTDDLTEEQDLRFAAAKRINETIQAAVLKELVENGGTLPGDLALKSVAVSLGASIKANRLGGPVSGLIVAVEMAQIILDIATSEDLP